MKKTDYNKLRSVMAFLFGRRGADASLEATAKLVRREEAAAAWHARQADRNQNPERSLSA